MIMSRNEAWNRNVFKRLLISRCPAGCSRWWVRDQEGPAADSRQYVPAVKQVIAPAAPRRYALPRRRWQFDSRRIYVRPRTGPQSAHLWWPAVAKLAGSHRAYSLAQLRPGTDVRTDGSWYRLMPAACGGGKIIGCFSVSSA